MSAAASDDRLGWIGAGRMGAALVPRLLDAGREVSVYNRTAAKAAALESQGATLVGAASDLADRDVVFTMVTGDEALLEVTTGPHGCLSGRDSAPALLVDSSTVSTKASEAVRARADAVGSQFLVAPVSGNPDAVRAGSLAVVVSGPEEAVERARPHLELFGASVTYVGSGDLARLVKICHNLILITLTASISEVLVLAERAGVSRSALLEFLNASVLASTFTRYKSRAFAELDFSPTATVELLLKDVELGKAVGEELGVELPLADEVRDLLAATVASGAGEADIAAMLEQRAQESAVELAR
ncbi:MAG: NAD(P)-dependent oxidoreductase [Solirubrobacterales bacterium]